MSAAPGWYPTGEGQLRYWDGRRWTQHIAPAPTPLTSPVPAPFVAPGRSGTSAGWLARMGVSGWFGWGGLGILAVMGAAGSGLSGLFSLSGSYVFVVAVVALVRGRVAWAGLRSRVTAAGGLGVAFALAAVGGATATPAAQHPSAAPTPSSTPAASPTPRAPSTSPSAVVAPKPTSTPTSTPTLVSTATAPPTPAPKPTAPRTAVTPIDRSQGHRPGRRHEADRQGQGSQDGLLTGRVRAGLVRHEPQRLRHAQRHPPPRPREAGHEELVQGPCWHASSPTPTPARRSGSSSAGPVRSTSTMSSLSPMPGRRALRSGALGSAWRSPTTRWRCWPSTPEPTAPRATEMPPRGCRRTSRSAASTWPDRSPSS